MILAGDIGGTSCRLAVFEENAGELRSLFRRRYSTRAYPGFGNIFDEFQRDLSNDPTVKDLRFTAAGFGVPGTVVDGERLSINLPWPFDPAALGQRLRIDSARVSVVNDLVAMTRGIENLPQTDFAVLNEGAAEPRANKAVLAAGTGLGEAMLIWDGSRHIVSPSEGSVASFAPRTDREIQLLSFMRKRIPRVCCEDIISGRGFSWIHDFLDPMVQHSTFDRPAAESAAEITMLALAKSCPVCMQTLDMWTEIFGAEAGNIAVRVLAYGGIYIAGGIAPKILPKLKDGAFVRAFCDKAKVGPALERIPISVVLNEDAGLFGAALGAVATGMNVSGD
jgi:glucokinase